MNGSKSSSQPGQEEDDVSSHDVRASDESSDHDVLMDDEDNPEENSEDGVESEKESPSVFSTNFTRGAVMEKCSERISNADSETDEKDTTLEDDDDSTVDDSDSSGASNTLGSTILSVDEIDQLIRNNPDHFIPPPQKLPDFVKMAASSADAMGSANANIDGGLMKSDSREMNTINVEQKQPAPTKKSQQSTSFIPVPTTYFSPKGMRRIMAHVTSLHDIRISHPSVKAVSIAMECFIRTFIQEAYRRAQRSTPSRIVIEYADLSYVAQHFTSLYFLQDFVPPPQTANVVVRTLLENDGYDVDVDLKPPSRPNIGKSGTSTDSSRKPGSFNFKSRASLNGGSKAAPVGSVPKVEMDHRHESVMDEEEDDDPEIIARRRALLRIAETWDGPHSASNWRNGLLPSTKSKAKKATLSAISKKKPAEAPAASSNKRVAN